MIPMDRAVEADHMPHNNPGEGIDWRSIYESIKLVPSSTLNASQTAESKDIVVHLNRDKSTRKVISEDFSSPTDTEHIVFDPISGNRRTVDVQYTDGTREHQTWDPTKNIQTEDQIHYRDGTTRRDKDNRQDQLISNLGSRQSSDWKFPDGSTAHEQFQYDSPGAEYPVSENIQFSNGTTNHVRFQNGNECISTEDIVNPDKSTIHIQHGSTEDGPAFAVLHYTNGASARVEWDANTDNERSVDVTTPDGSKQSFRIDPKSGKPKASIVPTWLADKFLPNISLEPNEPNDALIN
jgi:hypothetical protein